MVRVPVTWPVHRGTDPTFEAPSGYSSNRSGLRHEHNPLDSYRMHNKEVQWCNVIPGGDKTYGDDLDAAVAGSQSFS